MISRLPLKLKKAGSLANSSHFKASCFLGLLYHAVRLILLI